MKVFHTPSRTHAVKKICKRFGYNGVIRSQEAESFGRVTSWLLSQPVRRQALIAMLPKAGCPPLHIAIYQAFHERDTELAEVMPLEDFCRKDERERSFMDVPRFRAWLAQRRYTREQAHSVALVACAFAILQPAEASAILDSMLEHDPIYAHCLLPSEAEADSDEEDVEPEAEIATTEDANKEEEDAVVQLEVKVEKRPVIEGFPAPEEKSPKHEASGSGEVFTLVELRRGGASLKAFLQAQGQILEVIERLPAAVDNLRLTDDARVKDLSEEFRIALTEGTDRGGEAEEWLTALSDGLETEELAYLATLEPLLDTIRSHAGQPRETLDLLRTACGEVGKLLVQLISKIEARDKQLSDELTEIQAVDELLGRLQFQPASPLFPGDLLRGLQLQFEINAQLSSARTDRMTFILGKKRELQEQLEAASERYDAALLGPELEAQFQEVREAIQQIDGAESLTASRGAYEQLVETLRANPEVRNLTDLASEALVGPPMAAGVLPVARALNVRGRASEALALLTCLQVTTEVESSGLDDFSGMADELMRAAATLANAGSLPFAWIDGVFQQPWIRDLRHSDLRSSLTWQRLAVAFVVQKHLRETEQETDLAYRLEFQKFWPKERYPILGRLLRGIGIRQTLRILPEPPASRRQVIESNLAELFRKNDYGEYLRQAGKGGNFYNMERLHLFPAMERIRESVRAHCEKSEWEAARIAADHDADKLLRKACNVAGIDANTSAFDRRVVVAPQTGYVPEFLHEISALIDAAMDDGPSDTEYVLESDLLIELAALESQQAGFASFWTAVRQTLSQSPMQGLQAVNSGEQLLVELCNRFGPVTTLSTGFTTALCNEGAEHKPARDTLEKMLRVIAEPPTDGGLVKLQTGRCYRHALLVLDQLDSEARQQLSIEELATFEARLREQMAQTETDLATRWRAVVAHPQAGIPEADYQYALAAGYFGYLQKMISTAEERVARASEEQRGEVGQWLRVQLDRLTQLKNASSVEETSEAWVETVFDHCSQLEKLLVMARSNTTKGRPLGLPRTVVENALAALKFVIENNAQSFDEVQSYLAELTRRESDEQAPPSQPPEIAIPEIAAPWRALSAMIEPVRERARLFWEDFARQFASAARLYHDLHKTLHFSAITGYSWGRYSTRFYDPRSGWLDREVRFYLCFGEKTSPDKLETLAVELGKSRDSVNLVFVPNGMGRLTRLWKYVPFRSPYVLIGEELLAQICAAKDQDGNARHDVPLRQAIHQAAESLTVIGLFKSDGYVHQHKNLFVGREHALHQLTQQPASVIWGGRRTGKTSLLHALAERLTRPNITGGAFDAVALVYGDDNDMAIAQAIAADLKLAKPETLEQFKTIMREACRRMRIAILIDETDGYIRHSREIHGPTEFPLARILRGLSQSDSGHGFKLVYAGFKQLFYQVRMTSCSDPSDPFKNIAEPVTKDFRNLKPEEVQKLMKISFEEMLGGTWDNSVPRLIFEKTSGHPAFVQCFCERLLERLSTRRQAGIALRVQIKDLQEVYEEQSAFGTTGKAFIDYVNETLNWNVSHLGRAILLALCSEIQTSQATYRKTFTASQIIQSLKHLCVNPAHDPADADFEHTLQMLTMTNMLTAENTGTGMCYRITYPAYVDFMQRLDQLHRQEFFSSLEAYHNEERGQIK